VTLGEATGELVHTEQTNPVNLVYVHQKLMSFMIKPTSQIGEVSTI